MSKDAVIEIEIINWDKYNPKRDQQTYTWLRLDNSVGIDPDLFGLAADQKFLWVVLLCEASKKNSAHLRLTLGYLEHVTGIKRARIRETLEFLEQKPMCRVRDNARPPVVAGTTPTNERTNVTNETNERDETDDNARSPAVALTLDFEPLYQKYPLKKGKEAGIKGCLEQILTQEDFDALSGAIDRYTADLKANRTETKFIKHFSSFIGTKRTGFPWREWLSADAGTAIDTGGSAANRATARSDGNQATLAAYKARLAASGGPHGPA